MEQKPTEHLRELMHQQGKVTEKFASLESALNAIRENLAYITNIRKAVKTASRRKAPQEFLDQVSIESCGKSRVYLGGLAETLHRRNLRALHRQMHEE